jgi:hypothetical protein
MTGYWLLAIGFGSRLVGHVVSVDGGAIGKKVGGETFEGVEGIEGVEEYERQARHVHSQALRE